MSQWSGKVVNTRRHAFIIHFDMSVSAVGQADIGETKEFRMKGRYWTPLRANEGDLRENTKTRKTLGSGLQ